MQKSDASHMIFSAAEALEATMKKQNLDEAQQFDALLRAVEEGSGRIRGLFEEISEGPDDPNEKQKHAIAVAVAQLVRIGASAALMLVIGQFPPMEVAVIGWKTLGGYREKKGSPGKRPKSNGQD